MSDDVLKRLASAIRQRRAGDVEQSYTRQLLEAGPERCAKKLGEEAVETVIAGVVGDVTALKNESADLIFHLLVLLESRGISLEEVLAVLESRMGTSGVTEKASRGNQN
jgi:phosphoribosyl-ATP pyrophosphohydrolase